MAISTPFDGYNEVGETIAGPIVEGYQSLQWGYNLAEVLGYSRTNVRAWIEAYSIENADRLAKVERRREEKRRSIDQKKKLANELAAKTRPTA